MKGIGKGVCSFKEGMSGIEKSLDATATNEKHTYK